MKEEYRVLMPFDKKRSIGYIQDALQRPDILNSLLELQVLEEVEGEEILLPIAGVEISPKDELMVHYFTDIENKDTYGNVLASYRLAYGRSALHGEASLAFAKENVKARVEHRLSELGLNDMVVNMEQLKLIRQDADKAVKRQAIADYKKERQKLVDEEGGKIVLNIIDYKSLNENKDDNITVQLQPQS